MKDRQIDMNKTIGQHTVKLITSAAIKAPSLSAATFQQSVNSLTFTPLCFVQSLPFRSHIIINASGFRHSLFFPITESKTHCKCIVVFSC
jgi:hypothetical protein